MARKSFIVQYQLGLHSESSQPKHASQRNVRKSAIVPVNMFLNVDLMGVCMCVFVYMFDNVFVCCIGKCDCIYKCDCMFDCACRVCLLFIRILNYSRL